MNSRRRRRDQWSSLPRELLTIIGERLYTRIDVLRFRAVCTSWRSSILLSHNSTPHFPIKLPYPISSNTNTSHRCTLTEITLYRFELPDQDDDDNSNELESSPKKKGWLVKVEEWKPGKYRLLNPLSQHQIRHRTFPKKLNLLDYRVFELSKAYRLEYVSRNKNRVCIVDKVIYSADQSAVLVIYDGGKLAFLRLEDEKWTILCETWNECIWSDIMLYNGKFHVVDLWGEVIAINVSSMTITSQSNPFCCWIGSRKHFVRSSGYLYLIDQEQEYKEFKDDYEDEDTRHSKHNPWAYFRIYKLNEMASDGLEETSLMNRVAFLGDDCSFMASPEDLVGCKQNCIYYTDKDLYYRSKKDGDVLKGLNGHHTVLFNLEDGSMRWLGSGPCHFQAIYPPPTWFKTN